MLRAVVGLAVVAAGCGGGPARPTPVSPVPRARPPAPARPAEPPIGEHQARALLSDGLRRAGFRIRHDVEVAAGAVTVLLDGWDPDRAIGFEYQADFAGDPVLDARTRAALGPRVLVLDAGPEAALSAALDRFVAGLIDPAAPAR